MRQLPPDHPERFTLAEEVHARPPEPLETPARASYVAVLIDPSARDREIAHLAVLCRRFAIAPPASGATHFRAGLGALRLKWERHGEFSGYTFYASGTEAGGAPFSEPASVLLPPGWLAGIPGSTIVAAHARLVSARAATPGAALLSEHFGGTIVVGAELGEGSGLAFTDFRIHADGCTRFLVVDRGFTPRQAGRMLQRLFEIEAYRMLALLALPIALRQLPRILATEGSLAALTQDIARGDGNDEGLLQELTRLAAEVESEIVASQFRFGAARAYSELVTTRIGELRERSVPGFQTFDEFMARRFRPAMATCATAAQRLHALSERVARASGLLSTRVDIARARQNQVLLASMDRRAKLQLRLQQTVEGLSVAAIVYYVAGLIGYLAKASKAGGMRIEPDLAVGIAIPIVAVAIMLEVRRARRRVAKSEAGSSDSESGALH